MTENPTDNPFFDRARQGLLDYVRKNEYMHMQLGSYIEKLTTIYNFGGPKEWYSPILDNYIQLLKVLSKDNESMTLLDIRQNLNSGKYQYDTLETYLTAHPLPRTPLRGMMLRTFKTHSKQIKKAEFDYWSQIAAERNEEDVCALRRWLGYGSK